MTTTDIAGLCERLWVGCIYMCDSNTNCVVDSEKTDVLLTKAANTLEYQAAENKKLREEVRYLRNMVGQTQSDICPVDPADTWRK